MLRSRIDDFDFKNGKVQVREKKRVKGRTSARWVDLNADLEAVMRGWFRQHPGGQFTLARPDGAPLNVDLADQRFQMAVRGTRFEAMKGFHVLRHSFCSVLASKGVDQRIINSFVGHQDERTAARYRHLIPNKLRSAILELTS
jgi:integrase